MCLRHEERPQAFLSFFFLQSYSRETKGHVRPFARLCVFPLHFPTHTFSVRHTPVLFLFFLRCWLCPSGLLPLPTPLFRRYLLGPRVRLWHIERKWALEDMRHEVCVPDKPLLDFPERRVHVYGCTLVFYFPFWEGSQALTFTKSTRG